MTFEHCRSLETIHIPNSAIGIGEYAFAEGEDLRSINIPEHINNVSIYG